MLQSSAGSKQVRACLPCSAALRRAVMMGESLLVRYSVALMAAT